MDFKEHNQLIAEWMGAEKYGALWRMSTPSDLRQYIDKHDIEAPLKFHTDWNWLIPVVERIEFIISKSKGRFCVYIGSHNQCTIQDSKFRSDQPPYWYFNNVVGLNKIMSVYEAVVLFIEWYIKDNE